MESLGQSLSFFYCIPFVGMLLSIAVAPLINAEWWEEKRGYAVILWSLLFLIPFAIGYGPGTAFAHLAEIILGDYISFIVLLFGLFCVSGNICIKGDLAGTPKVNMIILLIGTALASWVGTTGASMLLIRPMIRANSWRKRKVHSMVFFIFLVSNIGGCLTPVGDPPLFMGFTHGVPFAWSFHTAPVLLINVILLSAIYMFIEGRAYKKDLADGCLPELGDTKEKIRIEGAHNFIFIGFIVGAVILSGTLGNFAEVFNHGVVIEGEVVLSYATIVEMVIILLAALLSFKTTSKQTRLDNNFSWGAIEEVAVLFIGIFITMIPALLILSARGSELGIDQNWQMFWMTGLLSSFLDNTPTYLVFFETALSLKATTTLIGTVAIPQTMLLAISCGAVFMGANTYIGNAPNFMVKSVAEENGIRMPSFFGYMFWSIRYLIPVFLVDTILFFSGWVF
ncbi:MAG: sodium:proton antiporter [Clostridiales bacterium]|nr:sodium:proton antiporter [Candidatus Crickella merdequi]